jgi:regulator of protease activity HflC (stomatin/prohibitin superfamily)
MHKVANYVDQRIRVTDFKAETTLTKDTVPVNVDAIAFWMVWDAEKAVLEVEDFDLAVTLSAQTGLRDSIGRHELGDMLSHRDRLGKEIAESFASASEHYKHNQAALHLRAMNMAFEGLKQKGSMIIVPSTAVETMGLGAMGGLTAFDQIIERDDDTIDETPALKNSEEDD